MENAYHQAGILRKCIPLDEAIAAQTNEAKKQKLLLVKEVREFAKQQLGLNVDKNYSSFVELNRDYVTYVVNAAYKNKLQSYHWSFPIIGDVPYKGYFNLEDAKKLQTEMDHENWDTYLRGVSAFSTLGWFNDPLLSSMLKYSDFDLVSTIIHESVHATFYFKSQADFNETAASFLGNLGATLFYRQHKKSEKEIDSSIQKQKDEKIFSQFITNEIINLRKWYLVNEKNPELLKMREEKFKAIIENFSKNIKPQLSTDQYSHFDKLKLNNARLLLFETYMKNFDDLEKLYKSKNENFIELVAYFKSLEGSKNPAEEIKKDIGSSP